MRRRDLVAAVGTTAAIPLAGCVGLGSEDPAGGEPADSPAIGTTSIDTVGADCGGMDDESSWSVDDGAVSVEGHLVAPNPCHEARIARTDLDDGTLVVDIDAASTLGPGEACIECVGLIAYEARIEVDNASSLVDVRVQHVSIDA